MTRDPTGHGENATILTLSVSLGMYLGSLVDDPNLTNFIIGVTTLVGKFAMTVASNWLGGPVASFMGAGAMKGAKLGVILLAVWLPLGCTFAITGQGLIGNFGQSSVSTCGEASAQVLVSEHPGVTWVDAVADEQPDVPEGCTVVKGASVSEQASNVLGGVLAGALRMLGLSYGVPAAE